MVEQSCRSTMKEKDDDKGKAAGKGILVNMQLLGQPCCYPGCNSHITRRCEYDLSALPTYPYGEGVCPHYTYALHTMVNRQAGYLELRCSCVSGEQQLKRAAKAQAGDPDTSKKIRT